MTTAAKKTKKKKSTTKVVKPKRKKTTKRKKIAGKKRALVAAIDLSKELGNKGHERFCEEYHVSLNATDAYKKAYPNSSQRAAETGGSRLLRIAKVAGRLAYLRSQLSVACGIKAEDLMDEWAKIAFSNARNFVKTGNIIYDLCQLPAEVTAAVSSISTTTRSGGGKTVKLTFCSKDTALENMGKMLGVYERDNYQRQGLTLADIAALAGVQHGDD